MRTTSASDVVAVLPPGHTPRVLGVRARTRNERAAARAGVRVVDPAERSARDGYAFVIGTSVIVEPSLFAVRPPQALVWIVGADGARVLAGRAPVVNEYLDGSFQSEVPSTAAPAGTLFDISSTRARRRAGSAILRKTEKPTDGWVARHLDRHVSRAISRALLPLRVLPSHASILTLLVGLVAAWFAATPGRASFAAAGLLFLLTSVLDGVDGEIARATLTESEAGARLDTLVDHVTYVACLAGVTIGWMREGGRRAAILWTVSIGAALVASLLRAGRFVARYAPDASFVFVDRCVRRAAHMSGSLPLKAIATVFALLRRDVFAVVFLAVTLANRRDAVAMLVAGGVVLANITFSIYRDELIAAAELECRDVNNSSAQEAVRIGSRAEPDPA